MQREELIGKAVGAILAIVEQDSGGSFRSQEDALARTLADAGREATRQLLCGHVEPQPENVLIDGERYRKVLEEGSCRPCTPFGVVAVPRALYRRVGERGIKGAATIGLLEKRAGIIDGATQRMAEIISFYDASVPSREAERLQDLAGLRGPRRAAIEKKAGSIGSKLAEDADALLAKARSNRPLPDGAAMITIGMDRVNVAYEEPNPDGVKSERTRRLREKKPYVRKEPEPVTRQFRGDFVGSVAIRDEHGELVGRYAYGLSHADDPRRLAKWLAADVAEAVRRCPEIRVSVCQDGARELWPLTWEALRREPDLAEITIRACVDFHHFSPRVREVVAQLWGADAYPDWERTILDRSQAVFALDDAILSEVEALADEITPAQEAAVHDFQSYIEERTRADGQEDRRGELFDYAGLRAVGLPIGSGPTEATAKSLASVRMKRCGHRWSVPGARATLTSRAIMLSSDTWDIVWRIFAESHQAEVIPLHGNGELDRNEESGWAAA